MFRGGIEGGGFQRRKEEGSRRYTEPVGQHRAGSSKASVLGGALWCPGVVLTLGSCIQSCLHGLSAPVFFFFWGRCK